MIRNSFLVNLTVGFVKLTGYIPALIFLKPRVIKEKGVGRLPKPAIIVSNHKSLMDFVLYLIVFPLRTIRFLMAEVLFNKGKFFAWFLRALGGIKVDRDAHDFSFVSDSVEVLEGGGTLGVFPEARLPINGKPFPFTVSTAFIATHSDAPIVPIYTDGNYGIKKRTSVVIGKPFLLTDFIKPGLSEEEQLQQLTNILHDKVYDLKILLEKGNKDHAK